MGGGYVYNFPQPVAPGQTIDVPLVLTAPTTDGTYESQWMFQTPDGITFGVGDYSVPFTAKIVVSSAKKPDYGITTVDYRVVRDPASGCPANVWYTVYATITTSGPIVFTYYWAQWDGNDGNPKTMKFESAGSKTVSRDESFHLGSSTTHDKWMQIIVVDPLHQEFDRAMFEYTCK